MRKISSVKIFFGALLIFNSLIGLSRHEIRGVYLTVDDFKNNNLKFSSVCTQQGNIKLQSKSLQEQKVNIPKSDVFGVGTCKGTWRIYKNNEFKIINTDSIVLYTKTVAFGEDSYVYEDAFFFSVKLDTEIVSLTKAYLEIAFSENKKFPDLIDTAFRERRN